MTRPTDLPVRLALLCGVAVPVLYYGSQLVAAPFFPDYSFVRQSASMLGSDLSTRPWVLNTGAILTGMATLLSAGGLVVAFRRAGAHPIPAWLLFMALVSCGAGSVWAGVFPLPDPRHNPGPVGVGMFLLPVLFAAAGWKVRVPQWLRWYLLANFAAFVLMMPVMSGAVGIDTREYTGLLQRVASAILFVPVGVTAAELLRRTG
jgi:hypothetical membrane protein